MPTLPRVYIEHAGIKAILAILVAVSLATFLTIRTVNDRLEADRMNPKRTWSTVVQTSEGPTTVTTHQYGETDAEFVQAHYDAIQDAKGL